MRMSRARAVAVILALVVLPAVVLVAHLTRPMPIPTPVPTPVLEGWREVLRPYPGKGAACVQFNAVFRDPEACDVVWLPPERQADQFAQRVREDENRRRRAAFLAWLKTERELRR
jgi:hypothetical protein